MAKKLLALVVCFALCAALVGCGGTKEVTFKGESDKIDLIIAYANQLGVEEIKNG